MASTLVQSGSSLQLVDEAGALTTLALPTGITLQTDRVPRFALFGRYVVMTNTPTRPITIDPLGVVRVLCPFAPSTAITLASGGAGALTGVYKGLQTFVLRDQLGNIIAESDFGPVQATGFTAAANTLNAVGMNISADAISGSRIYRNLNGGSIYFLWRELDGNVNTTSDNDDLADLALDDFAAPDLGTPPNGTLIAEFKGRLWMVDRVNVDDLRYSESGLMYAWPVDNELPVPRPGADSRGITAMCPRKDYLVVGRQNNIHHACTKSDDEFCLVKVTDEAGIESNESCAVYKDTVFFLWKDGVYTLSAEGITCISDKGGVRSWFAKDDTFNRNRFQYAFGFIDPIRRKYRLFLAAAGSSVNDRWVEYDLQDGTWWGPHKTGAFTPQSGVIIPNSGGMLIPFVGSTNGYLWQEQSTATDDTATAIDFDVDTGFLANSEPNIEKAWGRLTMIGKVQSAGTLQVTPYVGGSDAAARLPQNYQMTLASEKLARLGRGALARLNFRHTVVGEPVELYGFEVEEPIPLGTR